MCAFGNTTAWMATDAHSTCRNDTRSPSSSRYLRTQKRLPTIASRNTFLTIGNPWCTKSAARLQMKHSLLALVLIGGAAFAADEVGYSAEGVSVSDDGVTTYTGDVVISVPQSIKYQIKSKQRRTDG